MLQKKYVLNLVLLSGANFIIETFLFYFTVIWEVQLIIIIWEDGQECNFY